MRSFRKKLTVMLAALIICGGSSLAACGKSGFVPPTGEIVGDEVKSNGGFAVEKGNFVYFINGAENSGADNTYGTAVKGALYRIDKTALKTGAYDKAQRVVPSLFVAQNYDGGIFIYDDYVYFASPTTEKEKDGNVSNSWLSFKRAKIDGTSTKKEIDEYLFRLDDNTVSYRFVKGADNTVYCMYVKDSTLYSYNVATGNTAVLVKDAAAYYFDTENLENGNVYYLMNVPTNNTAGASTYENYNQLYCVTPDASATVNADATSYTVAGYKTYSFDRASIVKDNADFDASDITQYPYVNLGRLVLDGIGGVAPQKEKTQFNDADENNGNAGYTYAILAYRNGRALITRKDNQSSSSDTPVYSFTDAQRTGEWNSVKANKDKLLKVADTSSYATKDAVYYEAEGGALGYLYVNNSNLYRTVVKADGTALEEETYLSSASVTTLWKTEGDYLYYYGAGSSGNNLYRINYTGEKKEYLKNQMISEESGKNPEYTPSKILDVQWNDSWYKPEFYENVLLYSNAQSFGSQSFNYIYTVNLNGADGAMMNGAELNAFNEKYKKVTEYIEEFSDSGDDGDSLVSALKYYFRTGETAAYDEFLSEAEEKGYKQYYRYGEYAQAEFKAFTTRTAHGDNDYSAMFKDGDEYYDRESYFIKQLGETNDADKEEIESIWRTDFIKPLPEEEEDTGWSTAKTVWVTIAIVAGSLALIAGITVPIVISHKKKAKLAADYEATAVKKNKIDTTDDKSIDVYETEKSADEESEEEAKAEEEATEEEAGENAEAQKTEENKE
ncbi:MAG: hypothetical protein SPH68_00505 [Candidatus Borkfalkiaceae bacterium]|nr:hypothetical protein [Clostridia bacterium]MDY6222629.1 hypothetical protein [Christensenellaceae bacterium]